MPKYAVLIYWPEVEQPAWGSPEFEKLAQSYAAFNEDIGKTGIMTFSEGLQPTSTVTTVRVRNGKTLTTAGPFAETPEQLGAVWVFECKDLEEAISWAARIPQAQNGSVEIRPPVETVIRQTMQASGGPAEAKPRGFGWPSPLTTIEVIEVHDTPVVCLNHAAAAALAQAPAAGLTL